MHGKDKTHVQISARYLWCRIMMAEVDMAEVDSTALSPRCQRCLRLSSASPQTDDLRALIWEELQQAL